MIVKNPSEKPTLCIVCPCYNEQEVIEHFHRELTRTLEGVEGVDHRLIFVDDGSADRTLEILQDIEARDKRVGVYSLSRNFGHQVALTAGLDRANADAVVMMDCDMQHPPEVIPKLVESWRAGADVVSAIRDSTADSSLLKRVTSRAFYYLINRVSETTIVPNAADFCLLSRKAHQALCALPERHRFLRGMVSWIGFPREYVEFQSPPRAAGESKYTMRKMLQLARDAAFSFSSAPIRMASRLGAGASLLGSGYLAYIIIRYLFVGDLVPGWSSLICVTLIVGGFQLFFLGLVGEYVARVFEESKRRPLYFFKREPAVEASVAETAQGRAEQQRSSTGQ